MPAKDIKLSISPVWLVIPAGIIVAAILSYSFITGNRIAEKYTPLQDAAMEIKYEAVLAHLWFEEFVSGDPIVRISTVWQHLDQSVWYARAMLDGGENKEGVYIPLQAPELRHEIEEVVKKLAQFRQIAEQRLTVLEQSGIGSDIDQAFDAVFNDLIKQADDVETALQLAMALELHRFRIVNALLIVMALGISLLVGFILMRFERRRNIAVAALRNSETHLRTLIENVPDLIWLKDANGVYLNCNLNFENLMDVRQIEVIGKTDYDFFDKEMADFFREKDNVAMVAGKPCVNEEQVVFAGDGHLAFLETIKAPMFDVDEQLIGVLGVSRDITERKRAEQKLTKANRLFATLSQVNQAIVREQDKLKLFQKICNIAIEFGKFKLAWIGLIDKEKQSVIPVAYCGEGSDYLRDFKISLTDDLTTKGPAGRSINTEKSSVFNDLENDPDFAPWRERALVRGYRSAAGFPIKEENQVIGTFLVYSSDPDFFDEEEITLLEEAAQDISFALDNFEVRARRNLAEQEVKLLNQGLELQVHERTHELEKANERLKELDHLKSMFIASMSHELRTPLNSIIGFTGMIVGDMAGPISEQQRDYLQRVLHAGQHLLVLITDVIDISKIEAGMLATMYETFKLDELIAEALNSVAVDVQEKKLKLTSDVLVDIEMYNDRSRLLQCLLNLLSNAIKYSEQGSIHLQVKLIDARLEISVSDTGIGIADYDLKNLFKPFVRLESPLRMYTNGTGLGLYLTQKLTREILGGEISVSSQSGQGSTFTLNLPQQISPEIEVKRRSGNDTA